MKTKPLFENWEALKQIIILPNLGERPRKHLQFPMRMVSQFDLSRELDFLAKYGATVPHLNPSNYMPTYSHTRDDGVEVYSFGITVPEGCVIDDHGNVVNLAALERAAFYAMFKRDDDKKRDPISAAYDKLVIKPMLTNEDPSEKQRLRDLYAKINFPGEKRETRPAFIDSLI